MIDNLVMMIVVVHNPSMINVIDLRMAMMINNIVIILNIMINEIILPHSMINVIVLHRFTINDHQILDHITIKIDPADPFLIIEIFHLQVMIMKTWVVTQLQSMKKTIGWTPMIQCQNAKIQEKIHDGTQEVEVDPEMTQGILGPVHPLGKNHALKKYDQFALNTTYAVGQKF